MIKHPNIWIVCGTGTDVGKTFAASGLLLAAHKTGKKVCIIKPVQTGCTRSADGGLSAPDLEVYREACPNAEHYVLHCFERPCSPHLAAKMEGGALCVSDLKNQIIAISQSADITIVEAAGGLLVPLNKTETFADLAVALGGRIIVVAANELGAINHTLLTLEALSLRGLDADLLILNQLKPILSPLDEKIIQDNAASLQDKVPFITELPFYSENFIWEDVTEQFKTAADHLLSESAKNNNIDFDNKHLWHPYAPTTPPNEVWEVASTKGTEIYLADGRTLVDGMSSWWATVHGYNHPELVSAIQRQATIMPHVMFGGLTHEPAVRLGKKLLELAPKGLERIFYADSGSVAVEAAMKMALQYHQAAGHSKRTRFLTALGGYHGDTIGAMSVCDPENGMHTLFTDVLAKQLFVERPSCRFDEDFDKASLEPMRKAFKEHADEIAAVIIEPIVQGAGGMWFYHPEYLRGLRELCDEYSALLILDEIATGFGRTGRMFAAEWAGISPDIMCIGKALTGGSMTLSAVLTSENIAATISQKGVFMHGPTFMANPLACALAHASLDLLTKSDWQVRVHKLEYLLRTELEPCRQMQGVADVRVLGAIAVVEMEKAINIKTLQAFFVNEGVWIRPFAKLIYIMPPFIATEADIHKLTLAIHKAIGVKAWQ